ESLTGSKRRRNRLLLVDYLHHIETLARNDAHLMDVLLLLGPYRDTEHGRADQPLAQRWNTQCLNGVDQQIAALLLVLVAGQARTAHKVRWGDCISSRRRMVAIPG